MDKPISVGDLVVVVLPTFCCGNDDSLGGVHLVTGPAWGALLRCPFCMSIVKPTDEVTLDTGNACEKRRLKRIPPLDELEGVLSQHEIKHPLTGKVPA
jgi:hypothetical protein